MLLPWLSSEFDSVRLDALVAEDQAASPPTTRPLLRRHVSASARVQAGLTGCRGEVRSHGDVADRPGRAQNGLQRRWRFDSWDPLRLTMGAGC